MFGAPDVDVDDASFEDDEVEGRLRWLRRHLADFEVVEPPGRGATTERFRTLSDLGRADGSLGRLAEGHLDAVAILDELGRPATDAAVLRGVWAARPELLKARPSATAWQLTGRKPWCSGAAGLDRALVTALDEEGSLRLFDIEVAALEFDDDWHPIGMRASDSRTARVDVGIPFDSEIGPPGGYVARAGFGHGGVGVAAVWHGLARRLVNDLGAHATNAGGGDPHVAAAAGVARAVLGGWCLSLA